MNTEALQLERQPGESRPRLRSALADLLADMRRRWLLTLLLFAIWTLACLRLFVDPTPRIPLLFNWTPSLPFYIAWMGSERAPKRGDYVVYAFAGEAQQHYRGLRGQPFFKRVTGLPGDTVSVEGRLVLVNGQPVGIARTHGHDRHPLATVAAQVIPAGHYYVQGTSPDSFDSRYAESGLVRAEQILGVVLPLL